MRFAQHVTMAGAALVLVLFAEAQPVEGKYADFVRRAGLGLVSALQLVIIGTVAWIQPFV